MNEKHRQRLRTIMNQAGKIHTGKHPLIPPPLSDAWRKALKLAWKEDKGIQALSNLNFKCTKSIAELCRETKLLLNKHEIEFKPVRKKVYIQKPVDLSSLPVGKIKPAGVYRRTTVNEGRIEDRSKLLMSGGAKFEMNNRRTEKFGSLWNSEEANKCRNQFQNKG